MKRLISSGLLVASVSLMLAVPAFAQGTSDTDRMNGTTYTNTGVGGVGTYSGPGTNTYGTGTDGGYTSGVTGTGLDRTNNYTSYGTTTYDADRRGAAGNNGNGGNNGARNGAGNDGGRYRAAAAGDTSNDYWGWLGLLGLIGLAGLRSKNPQRGS